MTRTEMLAWFRTAEGHAWNPRTERPNTNRIIAAIEAGTVTPDDNDGLITDPTEQLLWGALMSGEPAFWQQRVAHLTDLTLMAGDSTTRDEAAWLRDHLINLGLLDWENDSDGGWLTATDAQFESAVSAMCAAMVTA